jgi:hypothetical protein
LMEGGKQPFPESSCFQVVEQFVRNFLAHL